MAGPNPKLEAAFKQFGNERGITPEQVNQLRETIVNTPVLLKAYNEDAENGHVQSFLVAPLGGRSIGFYNPETNKVGIPSDVLSGKPPVDRDLATVLKLQDMSLRFAKAPGITADMHGNLQQTLNGSPILVDQLKEAVRDEAKRDLVGFDINSKSGSGATYNPARKTMNLNPSSLSSDTFNQSNLTHMLGHELQHTFNRGKIEESKNTYYASLRAIAGDDNPVNDYTAPMKVRMQDLRRDEAEAEINGWNTLLSYERERTGRPVSLQGMWNNTSRQRVEDYLVLDGKGHAIARPGLQFNSDNSLSPTTGPNGNNIEAMGRHFFDQPPAGTRGVRPQDTMTLGPHGHSDYKNSYGAAMISQAILYERGVGQAKHGEASQMHLNMRELGFKEKLIEENGLYMKSGSKASQAYFDTSTSPPKARHFDLGVDGQNKNRHGPAEAQEPAGRARTLTPTGAGHGGGNPAHTDPTPQPKPSQAPLMSNSAHLAHEMYLQALKAFDASPNIPANAFSQQEKERLAAGVVAQALTQKDAFPQARIDHVVFSADRSTVIGVMGALDSPSHHLAAANVQGALATALTQSSQVSQTALESLQQNQGQQVGSQAQSVNMEAPTRGALHH